MVLEGVAITWSELLALIVTIPSVITVPITVWLVKLKGKTERHDEKFIEEDKKLEAIKLQVETTKLQFETQINKIDLAVTAMRENILESREVHHELREEMKEIKTFFIDWIQRIEDVTRDSRKA